MAGEPRVRITSDGVGPRSKVYVGEQILTNCFRAEIVIDAREVVTAVLHLYDVEVDVDLAENDVVVMLTPMEACT